jgi:hypothetical protein
MWRRDQKEIVKIGSVGRKRITGVVLVFASLVSRGNSGSIAHRSCFVKPFVPTGENPFQKFSKPQWCFHPASADQSFVATRGIMPQVRIAVKGFLTRLLTYS